MNHNSITFIGHSTLLIDIDGFRILTDPILTRWVYFIPRLARIKFNANHLSDKVDLILISHTHHDHLNRRTLKKFNSKTILATHSNNKKYLGKCKFDNIIELEHWQKKEFSDGKVAITSVPASHSKTLPWGPQGTASGFIIESLKQNIYFAGDTSFSKKIFRKIAKKFKINTLLMPIGAYSPRWMLKSEHTDPKEAIETLKIIKAKVMIPIHWGSFMLALDTPKKPIKILKEKIKDTELEKKIVILKNGESFYF